MSETKSYKVSLIKEGHSSVFKATNENGYVINIDGINTGQGNSASPIEMLIQSAGACSGVDVLEILKSDSEKIESFKMTISGCRRTSETPSYIRELHLNYEIEGDLNPDKLTRAISLSLEKYCTILKTLEAFAEINWILRLNGKVQMPKSQGQRKF